MQHFTKKIDKKFDWALESKEDEDSNSEIDKEEVSETESEGENSPITKKRAKIVIEELKERDKETSPTEIKKLNLTVPDFSKYIAS